MPFVPGNADRMMEVINTGNSIFSERRLNRDCGDCNVSPQPSEYMNFSPHRFRVLLDFLHTKYHRATDVFMDILSQDSVLTTNNLRIKRCASGSKNPRMRKENADIEIARLT